MWQMTDPLPVSLKLKLQDREQEQTVSSGAMRERSSDHPGEGAGREGCQAPPLPRSSLSRVQGYPQDGQHRRMKKDRDRDKERMTKLQWARPVLLYFPWGFYTLSCTYSKVKNAESTQHSISNNFYQYQVPSCKSLILCTSSSVPEACWYSMTSFW